MTPTNAVLRLLAFCVGLLLADTCLAQSSGYPDRPVKIIVPFAPAGPTDVVARLIAQKLSENLKQQFFIENQGGAGGNLGMGNAARSAPDGYTVLFVSSSYVVNPSLYAKVPYDPYKDFAPVTVAGDAPNLLSVHLKDQEADTFQAVLVPAGTPKEIVALLHREIVKVVNTPDVKARFDQLGFEVVANSPEEFAAQIRAEIPKWAKVIKDAKVKVE
jgi:tripartite-type tricarboxylate transporter receptor subunit TctC